ncbi:MAG: histidinol dehydrogenase [Flavobacteriales bacterium]|nr:histidinol dehydrogenase [Flavobacteriales bacterium]
MKKALFPNKDQWAEICARPVADHSSIQETVWEIIDNVGMKKDPALFEYALKFEGAELTTLKVSRDEFEAASKSISQELKDAIIVAQKNIEKFHVAQLKDEAVIETMEGVTCWRKDVAIQTVGLYIPGGTAPLFSTVLMLGIPAKIAGCKRVILCTPANKNGEVNAGVLFAAQLVGIDNVYKAGGAQAIAAMAIGTQSVPRVNKIFGPGNQYVTMAKQMVSQMGVAIDMPAGPSEVLVLADSNSNAEFVAADLLAQAEHGSDSQVILVSNSEEKLTEVEAAIESQLKELPRKDIAAKAMENSWGVILDDKDEVVDFVNEYAPEHLILCADQSEYFVDNVINAGSVFIGEYTPESAGDYASGTNHTLPTNGFAKAYSGVSVDSFVKKITYQKITKEGLKKLGPIIEVMAEAEELMGHKNAVTVRLKTL